MNALSRALKPQAPKDSGKDRILKTTLAKPSLGRSMPMMTVSADQVRSVGGLEGTFVTQHMFHEERTWAARNVDMVLAGAIAAPSQEELVAAARAVASLDSRVGEDTDEWAKSLGKIFGSYTD